MQLNFVLLSYLLARSIALGAIKLIYLCAYIVSCSIDCEVINLAHNKLRDLPNLQEQTELEELDVSKNEIRIVRSSDFKHLKSLRTLRLCENLIGKKIS